MSLVLLALALAPGLLIAIYVYMRDKYEKEPIGLLIRYFIFGGISVFVTLAISFGWGYVFNAEMNIPSQLFYAFFVVGLTEEFSKFIFLRSAYKRPEFNEPFDGIVYSVMISLGFATLENVLYVYQGGLNVAIVRMFTAVPAHAANAVMMGYFFGLAKFKKQHEGRLMLIGLLVATLFHGAYDFCLFVNQLIPIAAGAVITLIVAIVLSRRVMRLHVESSPFHPKNFFRRRPMRFK